MAVKILEESDIENYDDFIFHHKESMFYYTTKYRLFLEGLLRLKGTYLISLNEEGLVNGSFPLFYKEAQYGKIYNALPFYGSHGAILSDDKKIEEELYHYAQAHFFEEASAWTIINRPQNDNNCHLSHDYTDERIGQWTKLSNDEEELMALFDSSTRRNIRKSQKENIEVKIDNDAWSFLEETHYQNMNDMGGNAKDPKFFSVSKDVFEAKKDYNIYVAYKEGVRVSALLLFYFKDMVEYFVPVTVSEYRNSQPSAAIIYQAMMDAADQGYNHWNWGGTWKSQEGVYKFKKKWGACDLPYTYYTSIKNKDILNCGTDVLLKEYKNFYVVPFDVLKAE